MYEGLETSAPAAPRFVSDLDTLIRARYPLLYLVSWEEQRLDGILTDLAAAHGKVLLSWSITRGLRRIGGARSLPSVSPVSKIITPTSCPVACASASRWRRR